MQLMGARTEATENEGAAVFSRRINACPERERDAGRAGKRHRRFMSCGRVCDEEWPEWVNGLCLIRENNQDGGLLESRPMTSRSVSRVHIRRPPTYPRYPRHPRHPRHPRQRHPSHARPPAFLHCCFSFIHLSSRLQASFPLFGSSLPLLGPRYYCDSSSLYHHGDRGQPKNCSTACRFDLYALVRWEQPDHLR